MSRSLLTIFFTTVLLFIPFVRPVQSNSQTTGNIRQNWLKLRREGAACQRKDQWNEAERKFQKALKLAEMPEGSDLMKADSLRDLADLSNTIGQRGKASGYYKRCLVWREKAVGKADQSLDPIIGALSTIYEDQNQPQKAIPLVARLERLRAVAPGPASERYRSTIERLARLYQTDGQYLNAGNQWNRLAVLKSKDYKPDPAQVASMYYNSGSCYFDAGKADLAKKTISSSINVATRHSLIQTLGLCGQLLYTKNQIDEAEKALRMQRKMLLSEAQRDLSGLANNSYYLGYCRFKQHDLPGAEKLFRQQLKIKQQLYGSNSPELSSAQNSLASILNLQKIYDEAIALLRRAESIRKNLKPGPMDAQIAGQLALAYMGTNDLANAEEQYKKIVKTYLLVKPQDTKNLVSGYIHLAQVQKKQDKMNAALNSYQKALFLCEKGGLQDKAVGILLARAQIQRKAGRTSDAKESLERILTIDRSHKAEPVARLTAFVNLAQILDSESQTVSAKQTYLKAVSQFKDLKIKDQKRHAPMMQSYSAFLRRHGDIEEAEGIDRLVLQAKKIDN